MPTLGIKSQNTKRSFGPLSSIGPFQNQKYSRHSICTTLYTYGSNRVQENTPPMDNNHIFNNPQRNNH